MARFVDAHLLAKAYLDVAREEHLTGLIFLSPEDVANTIIKVSEELKNVEPVIHAHWVEEHRNYMVCSNCGKYRGDWRTESFVYCPHCGAKMDEEVKE